MRKTKEIINISKKRLNNINSIQTGKSSITNSSDKANEFNRHFTSVTKQIGEKLIKKNTITPNICRTRIAISFL